MNRRERKAQAYAERKARKEGEIRVPSTNDTERDRITQSLEPILLGLIEGTKKFVIESKPQRYNEGMGFTHTFKIVDSDSGTSGNSGSNG